MIKRFNEYLLSNEIDFLFNSTNESIFDFKNKLTNIFYKIKDIKEFDNLLTIFFNYLKTKSRAFKKVAIGSLLLGIVYNSNYDLNKFDIVIDSNKEVKNIIESDEEILDILEEERTNIIFEEYKNRADIYLSRDIFEGTPMTGSMFSESARKAYEKYGILVPLELALAQAQFESSFGRTGKSAMNNPFNVGEFDSGTKITFNSTEEGVDAYYNLIAKDYLSNKTVNELLNNFVNYMGKRYASGVNYESKIKKQFNFTKKWIDKNL